MKIIICGAGQVGFSIAGHLAVEDNDITVIDTNADRVQRMVEANDVRGVIGVASHPDILRDAGAEDADMLIAVTESDEINMVACQVAHSIFNIHLRIARIRAGAYLDPQFGDLYSPDNLPIDHIISPEAEVSDAVSRRLRVPGAFDMAEMCGGRALIVGVRCDETCPILGSSIRELTALFEDLTLTIIAIIRGTEIIVPRDGSVEMEEGDRVYFVCDRDHLSRAMISFGHEEPESRKVLIAGSGTVGMMVARDINKRFEGAHCTLIEYNRERAREAALQLPNVTIINGDALDPDILHEGGISDIDTFVALTDDDEVNVLSSLLARRFGAAHVVSLVNMASFVPLINTLGVDSVINPPAITVSSILQHVRRGRVRDIHTITEELGEVMEVEAMASSPLVGTALRKVKMPKQSSVGGILRGEQVLAVRGDTVIEPGDRVVIFAARGVIRDVEKTLSVRLDYF